MSRQKTIEQAKVLLEQVGMDAERCNDRSAMTFLALAHMDYESDWAQATGETYTTREIMDWIRDRLGVDYAANTRETIRRFTLHQFIAGGLVDYNADDPNRPTNSPKNNYRITPELVDVVHAIGTSDYEHEVIRFNDHIERWREQGHEARDMRRLPVRMPDGSVVNLSAGGQNVLIKAMVEELCARYAPGGEVVYIDDADKKQDKGNHPVLDRFGVTIPEHGKAPDLIVWLPDRE